MCCRAPPRGRGLRSSQGVVRTQWQTDTEGPGGGRKEEEKKEKGRGSEKEGRRNTE